MLNIWNGLVEPFCAPGLRAHKILRKFPVEGTEQIYLLLQALPVPTPSQSLCPPSPHALAPPDPSEGRMLALSQRHAPHCPMSYRYQPVTISGPTEYPLHFPSPLFIPCLEATVSWPLQEMQMFVCLSLIIIRDSYSAYSDRL